MKPSDLAPYSTTMICSTTQPGAYGQWTVGVEYECDRDRLACRMVRRRASDGTYTEYRVVGDGGEFTPSAIPLAAQAALFHRLPSEDCGWTWGDPIEI